MPKRVFWPISLVVLGIVLLASNVGMMPKTLWNLWPLLFIIVGLGGLLISDKDEWDTEKSPAKAKKTVAKKVVAKTQPKRSARAATKKRK